MFYTCSFCYSERRDQEQRDMLEKQQKEKERERMEREREREREKQEREDKERREQENAASKLVSRHFEESLRLANQKVFITPYRHFIGYYYTFRS